MNIWLNHQDNLTWYSGDFCLLDDSTDIMGIHTCWRAWRIYRLKRQIFRAIFTRYFTPISSLGNLKFRVFSRYCRMILARIERAKFTPRELYSECCRRFGLVQSGVVLDGSSFLGEPEPDHVVNDRFEAAGCSPAWFEPWFWPD